MSKLQDHVITLVVAVMLFGAGYLTRDVTWHPAPTPAQVKTITRIERQQAVNETEASAKAETQKEKVRVIYRQLAVAAPQIVTPDIDRAYPVPVGFVRLWNATAAGDVSGLQGATGSAAAEPSTVPLSAVADAHAADIEQCSLEQVKYQQLWDLFEAQAKIAGGAK